MTLLDRNALWMPEPIQSDGIEHMQAQKRQPSASRVHYGMRDARDAEFVHMLTVYRRSGGLASAAEVLSRSPAHRPRVMTNGRAQRNSICFQWEQKFWLPWFQFDPACMAVRAGPAEVIAELASKL